MRKIWVIALAVVLFAALFAGEAPNYSFPPAATSQAADPSNVVWVDSAATGGAGTEGNPWTGWDTAITWTAWTEYRFPKGYYSYATSPNFCLEGLALVGEQGAVLKYTGTDKAVNFSAADDTWVFYNRMENLRVQGHANADYGLWLVGLRSATFRNVKIFDFKEASLTTKSCVANVFDNIYIPHDATTKPKNGVVLDARPNQQTTVCNFINLIVEGASEKGIWIKNSFWNNFYGGAAENLHGQGLVITSNTTVPSYGGATNNDGNMFLGFDFELNNQTVGGANVEVRGYNNQFYGCNATGLFHLIEGKSHVVKGGGLANVTIDNGVGFTEFSQLIFRGTFTDNGNSTFSFGAVDENATGSATIGSLPVHVRTVNHVDGSGPNLNTNCNLGNVFRTVLFGNVTLTNPTNPKPNQEILWKIQQGGAGSFTLALDTKWRAGPHTVTLSTDPGKFDYIWAQYDSTEDEWHIIDFKKGY